MYKSLLFCAAFLCTLPLFSQAARINEINYAANDPTGRGVEVVAEAGEDLTGWSLIVYTAAGAVEKVVDLSGAVVPNQQNGYGTVWYDVVQNDGGGGAALADPSGNLTESVSYGSATLIPGLDATYLGAAPAGSSLSLVGSSFGLDGFSWAVTALTSPGSINTDQVFMALMARGSRSSSPDAAAQLAFPNPFEAEITTVFARPLATEGTLSLYDGFGRIVLRQQLVAGQERAQLITPADLPAGQYYLRCDCGAQRNTQKVVRR